MQKTPLEKPVVVKRGGPAARLCCPSLLPVSAAWTGRDVKKLSSKFWRACAVFGLTIVVLGSGTAVVTGLRALEAANEKLALRARDNVDGVGSQFEVEYLRLLVILADARDQKAPFSEVEGRRHILLNQIAMLGTSVFSQAPGASPELTGLITGLEQMIADLQVSASAAPEDLRRAERDLLSGLADVMRIRAASRTMYDDALSGNRAAAHTAFNSFSLSLAIMAVVTLAALYGVAISMAKRRSPTPEIETARLRAQQQASLAQLLDDISDLLLRYGMDGALQFAKGVEITDGGVFDFFRRSGRPAGSEALERLTPAEPGITHEVIGVRDAVGRERIERWSHRLIVTDTGAAEGFISTAQDITELRTLNDQLIQSSKLAALGEISAGIAHELMQPLNALKIGLANLRRRQTVSEDESPEAADIRFDRLQRQVSRAGDIVHTMRLLGRQSDLKLSPVALGGLLDETFQLFDRPLAVLGIQLTIDRPPDDLCVLAHPQFLLQVLINLLANARDALEGGTAPDVERRVHLGVVADDAGRVQIEVSDNGPGIPAQVMEKLFEAFATFGKKGGTGLGLAIVKQFVDGHGGQIAVESTGSGTCFTITLPNF